MTTGPVLVGFSWIKPGKASRFTFLSLMLFFASFPFFPIDDSRPSNQSMRKESKEASGKRNSVIFC